MGRLVPGQEEWGVERVNIRGGSYSLNEHQLYVVTFKEMRRRWQHLVEAALKYNLVTFLHIQ